MRIKKNVLVHIPTAIQATVLAPHIPLSYDKETIQAIATDFFLSYYAQDRIKKRSYAAEHVKTEIIEVLRGETQLQEINKRIGKEIREQRSRISKHISEMTDTDLSVIAENWTTQLTTSESASAILYFAQEINGIYNSGSTFLNTYNNKTLIGEDTIREIQNEPEMWAMLVLDAEYE